MERRTRIAAVAVVAAGLVTSACTHGSGSSSASGFRYTDPTPKGEVIPVAAREKPGPVSGELLDGTGTYSLAADAGHVVVLNLWGQWCSSCRVETPQFQQAYLDTRAEGVRFVGFDVKDDRERAQAYLTDNRVTYPSVYDQGAKVLLQLGDVPLPGLPITVLVDKHGRVAAAYIGPTTITTLKPAIAGLVAEA